MTTAVAPSIEARSFDSVAEAFAALGGGSTLAAGLATRKLRRVYSAWRVDTDLAPDLGRRADRPGDEGHAHDSGSFIVCWSCSENIRKYPLLV